MIKFILSILLGFSLSLANVTHHNDRTSPTVRLGGLQKIDGYEYGAEQLSSTQ